MKDGWRHKIFLDSVPFEEEVMYLDMDLKESGLTLVRVSGMKPKTYLIHNKKHHSINLPCNQFESIMINDKPAIFFKNTNRHVTPIDLFSTAESL